MNIQKVRILKVFTDSEEYSTCDYLHQLTLGRKGGEGMGVVFLSFFQDGKVSAPDFFSSCSFIPRAHFETRSVMVSFYDYEI